MVTQAPEDLLLRGLEPEATPSEDASETPEPEVQQAETPKAPEETLEFWRSQVGDLQRRAEKAENDFRSVQFGTMRQQERDSRLLNIEADQGLIKRTLKALVESGGDFDSLPGEVERIESEASAARLEQTYAEGASDALARIQKAVQGKDGKPLLDLNAAPELEEARALWDQGRNAKSLTSHYAAVIAVQEVMVGVRERQVAPVVPEKKAPEAPRKPTGANDMTVGRPVGGVQSLRNVNDVAGAIALAATKEEADRILNALSPELKRQAQERLGI